MTNADVKELLAMMAAIKEELASMNKKLDTIEKTCNKLAKHLLPKASKPLKDLPAEVLSKKMSEFGLHPKTVEKLASFKIHTLGDLSIYPVNKYESTKFGIPTRKRLRELYEQLDAYYIDSIINFHDHN